MWPPSVIRMALLGVDLDSPHSAVGFTSGTVGEERCCRGVLRGLVGFDRVTLAAGGGAFLVLRDGPGLIGERATPCKLPEGGRPEKSLINPLNGD